jgi:large subunit ribosomal protein L4
MATKPKTVKKAAPTKEKKAKKVVSSDALSAPIFDTKGKESGSIALPANLFGLSWNADLVHQVVTSMQANARTPIAHAKTRGEVRGGGRKPWKQKGTGRARHGSSRSPIWVGGGVAHGPRNDKSYEKKINKKLRTKALFVTLSRKLRDNEIIFVKTLGITEPKTARAKEAIVGLSSMKGFEALTRKKVNAALVATPARDVAVEKSFGNFRSVKVGDIVNLNPVAVLSAKYLIIENPEAAIEALTKRSQVKKG